VFACLRKQRSIKAVRARFIDVKSSIKSSFGGAFVINKTRLWKSIMFEFCSLIYPYLRRADIMSNILGKITTCCEILLPQNMNNKFWNVTAMLSFCKP